MFVLHCSLQGSFDYDVGNGQGAADPYSAVYISVSPLTTWQLSLPADANSAVDLSSVYEISMQFTGTAKPMLKSFCPSGVTLGGNFIYHVKLFDAIATFRSCKAQVVAEQLVHSSTMRHQEVKCFTIFT